MDLTSAFKSEIFRPLVPVVVPGFVAIAPFVIVAGHYIPAIPKFWNDHDSAFVAVFSVIVLAVGLILEGLGAFIESGILDGTLGKDNPDHAAEWDEYLQLRLKDEMIAQRYLRTVLVHLKFELSMIPALALLLVGLLWIDNIYRVWSDEATLWIIGIVAALIWYLAWQSTQSAGTLARTRRLILSASRKAAA
jgi:hypothetical protein